eukprot:jgi/Botrbrau1/214/Bobra.0022s0194.1
MLRQEHDMNPVQGRKNEHCLFKHACAGCLGHRLKFKLIKLKPVDVFALTNVITDWSFSSRCCKVAVKSTDPSSPISKGIHGLIQIPPPLVNLACNPCLLHLEVVEFFRSTC